MHFRRRDSKQGNQKSEGSASKKPKVGFWHE